MNKKKTSVAYILATRMTCCYYFSASSTYPANIFWYYYWFSGDYNIDKTYPL